MKPVSTSLTRTSMPLAWTALTTQVTTSPLWTVSRIVAAGSSRSCLMPRLMRSFSTSTSSTFALTIWPFSYAAIAVKAKVLDVDVEHLRLDDLALFVCGHRGLAGVVPGQVGHMDHAVDVRGQTDEQAEFRDVADFALDLGPDRVVVDKLLPRVALDLLEAERNPPLGT